jgi:hypothetical protein
MSGDLELERIRQNGGIFSAGGHQRPLIDSVQGEAEDSNTLEPLIKSRSCFTLSQSQELPSMRLRP